MLIIQCSGVSLAQKKKINVEKPRIALLGMYHFDNPNQDQFNVQSDDIFSAKRQLELEALVKRLATFKPTHIAVEFNKNDSALDHRYQLYLQGKYVLGASEREQIGFRLARILKHKHIYPVDEPSIQLNFNPTEELTGEFAKLLSSLSETGNNVMAMINNWIKHRTIGGVLHQLNADSLDKMNIDLYYRFLLPIGKGDLYPGVEAVASWYKRNLYILKHIKELVEADRSKKKILVIFGQAHTAMLKQFFQFSTEFELVNIRHLLPEN
jgi:hypothetical protein